MKDTKLCRVGVLREFKQSVSHIIFVLFIIFYNKLERCTMDGMAWEKVAPLFRRLSYM